MGALALVTESRRARLWEKAGRVCHWCRKPTRLCDAPEPDQATVDHVVPRCRGGSDGPENVVSACHACNTQRNQVDMREPGHPNYMARTPMGNKIPLAVQRQKNLVRMTAARDAAVRELVAMRSTLREMNARMERRERYWAEMPVWQFVGLRLLAVGRRVRRWG